jgi:hypothetical protein
LGKKNDSPRDKQKKGGTKMPHRIKHNEEQTYTDDPTTYELPQDHRLELVSVERTPMGSTAPVHVMRTWEVVFCPLMQEARLNAEREQKEEEAKKIADERFATKMHLVDKLQQKTVKQLKELANDMNARRPNCIVVPSKIKKAELSYLIANTFMDLNDRGLTTVTNNDDGTFTLEITFECDLCGDDTHVGFVDNAQTFKVCKFCDTDGSQFKPKDWPQDVLDEINVDLDTGLVKA